MHDELEEKIEELINNRESLLNDIIDLIADHCNDNNLNEEDISYNISVSIS